MSAGFMVWASLWFFLPLHIPFLVFGAASTARGKYFRLNIPKVVLSSGLIGIAILQITAAVMIFQTSRNTNHYEPQNLTPLQTQASCPKDYDDFGAGGLHLARMMLDRLRYTIDIAEVFNSQHPDEALPDHLRGDINRQIQSMNHLFCQAQNYVHEHHAGERLQIAQILMRGEILLRLDEALDDETRDYYYEGWSDDLRAWLAENPSRTDQAVPYLLWHVIHEQEARGQDIADLIYRSNPNDPVGAWFKGLYMIGQGQKNEGLILMRQALDHGIERVMVVEPEIKGMLER